MPEPRTDRQQLLALLCTMDVPSRRMNDLGWLNRNLAIRNSDHPCFPEASALVKKLLKAEA